MATVLSVIDACLAEARDAAAQPALISLHSAVNRGPPSATKVTIAFVELFQNAVGFLQPLFAHATLVVEPAVLCAGATTTVSWAVAGAVFLAVVVDVAAGTVQIHQAMKPLTAEALVRSSRANQNTARPGGFGMGLNDSLEMLSNAGYDVSFDFAAFGPPDARDRTVAWTMEQACGHDTTSALLHVRITPGRGEAFASPLMRGVPLMRVAIRSPGPVVPGDTRHPTRLVEGVVDALSRFECMYTRVAGARLCLDGGASGCFRSRDAFLPIRSDVCGRKLRLPQPCGCFLVYGIFTAAPPFLVPADVVVCVPGRGLPTDDLPVYDTHFRTVSYRLAQERFSGILDELFVPERREALRQQLLPLLRGGKTLLCDDHLCSALSEYIKPCTASDGRRSRPDCVRELLVGQNAVLCDREDFAFHAFYAAVLGQRALAYDAAVANGSLFAASNKRLLEEAVCAYSDWAPRHQRGVRVAKGGNHWMLPAVRYVTGLRKELHLRIVSNASAMAAAPAAARGASFRRVVTSGEGSRTYLVLVEHADDERTLADVVRRCAHSEDEVARAINLHLYLNDNNVRAIGNVATRVRTAMDLMRRKTYTLDIGDPLRPPPEESDDSDFAADDDEPPVAAHAASSSAASSTAPPPAPAPAPPRKRQRLPDNSDDADRVYLVDDAPTAC